MKSLARMTNDEWRIKVRQSRARRATASEAKTFHSSVVIRHSRQDAFTLLEVMIAVGILFMCLFAVLALTSNSLASARKLQQHRTIDTGTVAGLIYVQVSNTNQVAEGSVDVDLEEMYPGCKCDADLTQIASNGLCQIDFLVQRGQHLELQSHFLMYVPNLKQGGISSTLRTH
jgi:Prokaryotic N-terminal methylation motif